MPVTTSLSSNFCDSSLSYFDLKKLVSFYEDAVSSAEKKLSPKDALYEACSHIPKACAMTPKELQMKINENMKDMNLMISCFSKNIMDKSYFHKLYKPIDMLVKSMVASKQLDISRLDQAFERLKNSQNAEEVEHYNDMVKSGIKQFTYDIFAIHSNRLSHNGQDYAKELTPEKIKSHICANNDSYSDQFDHQKFDELIDSIMSES